MSKFFFKMQNILDLKCRVEDYKKQELRKSLDALEVEKNVLKNFSEERVLLIDKLRNNFNDKISIINLQRYNSYLLFIENKINKQKNIIKDCEKISQEKRFELIKATKERKMLDKLREKQYDSYINDEKQREQKIIDEIVSYNYSK